MSANPPRTMNLDGVVAAHWHNGQNSYPAGTFIHHPAGTSHIPQSQEGCVLFVFFPEG